MTSHLIRATRVLGPGMTLRSDMAIGVTGGSITEVRPWAEAPDRSPTLAFEGATIIPGLVDMHVHVSLDARGRVAREEPDSDVRLMLATANTGDLLRAGVTTACDLGGSHRTVFAIRDAIATGLVPGPRLISAGRFIAPPDGHGSPFIEPVVDDQDVGRAVDRLAADGADVIKVIATQGGGQDPSLPTFGVGTLRAIVERAHRHDLRVAAHAHGAAGIGNAVEARVDRIEHCSFLGSHGSELDETLVARIAADGIIVCPTNPIDHRRIEAGGAGAPRQVLIENWRRLVEAGVRIVMGSDAGVPDVHFDDYATGPELMVSELGMTPRAALLAATEHAADGLGLGSEIGSIEPGKRADLVFVDGDPLADAAALRSVVAVMSAGRMARVGASPGGSLSELAPVDGVRP